MIATPIAYGAPSGRTLEGYRYAAATAAASWWAKRLADGAGVGDNGDRSLPNLMARTLCQMTREKMTITPEICAAFATHLRDRILADMVIGSGRCTRDVFGYFDAGPEVDLDIDYHPTRNLVDSLVAAGIDKSDAGSMSILPLKTDMRVSARRVLVKHGYGADHVEIWGPAWGPTYEHERGWLRARTWEVHRAADERDAEITEALGRGWRYADAEAAGFIDVGFPWYYQWAGPLREPFPEPRR